MKKKPDLKPGDKFGWDDAVSGNPVWKIFNHWTGDCAADSNMILWHWKFIKRIRRKKRKPGVKARELWINETTIKRDGLKDANGSWQDWFESPKGIYIRTTPPENPEGWMHVVEQIE